MIIKKIEEMFVLKNRFYKLVTLLPRPAKQALMYERDNVGTGRHTRVH